MPLVVLLQLSSAQVLLNLQLPATGIYIKSQLWSFSIINTGAQSINVKIEMTFTDVSNNQRVFTASSNTLKLTREVTQLQAADLAPIIYNVNNTGYNVDVNPNGFLPIGQFEVCFAVMQITNETTNNLTEECETIEVEPVSPPILIEPADEEVTDVLRPFFTWVPPSPVASFNNLNYDWTLVEVQLSQNPADAIQQNIALHSQQGLPVNSLLYPSSLPELDTSKLYAWQVAAKSSNNAIAKSEVWTFKVRKYALDSSRLFTQGYYVPLKRQNDAVYTNMTGVVRYEYLNEINDSVAVIRFYDVSSTSRNMIIPDSPFVKLRFGQNYIETDIGDLAGMIDKHIYLLELVNSKEEKWYLKFEFRKPDSN